ncbi:MAG: hypothetical protein AAF441_16345 [Pseudomonadota bacterium]
MNITVPARRSLLIMVAFAAGTLSAEASEQPQPHNATEVQQAPECSVCTRRHQARARTRKQLKAGKKALPVLPEPAERDTKVDQ